MQQAAPVLCPNKPRSGVMFMEAASIKDIPNQENLAGLDSAGTKIALLGYKHFVPAALLILTSEF